MSARPRIAFSDWETRIGREEADRPNRTPEALPVLVSQDELEPQCYATEKAVRQAFNGHGAALAPDPLRWLDRVIIAACALATGGAIFWGLVALVQAVGSNG